MNRILLTLAVTNMTLLISSFAIGFMASSEPRDFEGTWRGLHSLFGILATLSCLLVHSIVYTYFLGTGKWIKEVERVYQIVGQFEPRARRNKKRTFPFEFWSMMLVGATAWLGAATETIGPHWAIWHLLVAGLAIGFNLGAHVVEYVSVVAQWRLMQEVKVEADRLRAAAESSAQEQGSVT